MGNFSTRGGVLSSGTKAVGEEGSGLASYVAGLIDRTLSWDDVKWLLSITSLKIVVKGIMTVIDAIQAVECGVDGIWVSNHGARQLDTAPATIEVLPDICRAVASRVEVYVDGGITRGTDVLKVCVSVLVELYVTARVPGSRSGCAGRVRWSTSAVGPVSFRGRRCLSSLKIAER